MHGIQTLPDNVEQVAVHNRRPVYKETVRVPVKDLVRDKDGNVVYKKDEKGNEIRTMPHTRFVKWDTVEREYQEVPLVNGKGEWTGITQKNYHFREDPAETARKEAEKAARSDLEEAAVLARQHGRSLKEMFAELLGSGAEPDFPKKLPGVGRWELSNGEVFSGTKAKAEEAEAALGAG